MRQLRTAALLLCVSLGFAACAEKAPSTPKSGNKKPDVSQKMSEEQQLYFASANLLKTYCHQCHGLNQTNSGGLTNITDLDHLIGVNQITPGKPEASKIYERMMSSTSPMPPAGQPKPSAQELETFKKWVASGAQTKFAGANAVQLIPEEQLLKDAGLDLLKEFPSETDRKKIRYVSFAAAQNAGASAETIKTMHQATAKLLNSLSTNPTVYQLKFSTRNNLLVRFSLDDLGWTDQDWNKIVKAYPYQVVPNDRKILAVLQEQTGSTLPIVRADWLIANASQPPLYYDILNLPTKFTDFTKMLNIDLPQMQKELKIMRAGFNNSEVADFSRVIERVESPTNFVLWHSSEFGSSFGDKNPFDKPFGPGRVYSDKTTTLAYNEDGKESIYTLPNSFLAFYVSDQLGNRLNAAPTRARNSSFVSGVATVGVACMTCHSQGLLEKRDQIRAAALRRADLSQPLIDLLKAIYPEPDQFIAKIKEDTLSYQNALKTAGVDFSQPDPVSRIFKSFNDSVNLKVAAGELGVPEADVKRAIENSTQLTNALSALTTDGTVSRATFTVNFQNLMSEVYQVK